MEATYQDGEWTVKMSDTEMDDLLERDTGGEVFWEIEDLISEMRAERLED